MTASIHRTLAWSEAGVAIRQDAANYSLLSDWLAREKALAAPEDALAAANVAEFQRQAARHAEARVQAYLVEQVRAQERRIKLAAGDLSRLLRALR